MGIGQAEISMIETHGWIPPLIVRQQLAVRLEVPIDELFDTAPDDPRKRDHTTR